MSKPVAVLISDVHYSLNTLELADSAFRQAIDKAASLKVPLIDCGDLTNDKAILRAEVVNRLLETFKYAERACVDILCIVGNHSLINEKGTAHALHFIPETSASIVDSPLFRRDLGLWLLPYYSNSDDLKVALASIPEDSTIICHQGVGGAYIGHYVRDKSSVLSEEFDGYRVISGHYHMRQTIKCGKTGVWDYIGNPYTLTFGEATDPPKGFQVLNDDGSLTFIPTNLRKHVVLEAKAFPDGVGFISPPTVNPGDLVWVKLSGSKSELDAISKSDIADLLGIKDFKLDKIVTDRAEATIKKEAQTGHELMDGLIDRLAESPEQKQRLKDLWRTLA